MKPEAACRPGKASVYINLIHVLLLNLCHYSSQCGLDGKKWSHSSQGDNVDRLSSCLWYWRMEPRASSMLCQNSATEPRPSPGRQLCIWWCYGTSNISYCSKRRPPQRLSQGFLNQLRFTVALPTPTSFQKPERHAQGKKVVHGLYLVALLFPTRVGSWCYTFRFHYRNSSTTVRQSRLLYRQEPRAQSPEAASWAQLPTPRVIAPQDSWQSNVVSPSNTEGDLSTQVS